MQRLDRLQSPRSGPPRSGDRPQRRPPRVPHALPTVGEYHHWNLVRGPPPHPAKPDEPLPVPSRPRKPGPKPPDHGNSAALEWAPPRHAEVGGLSLTRRRRPGPPPRDPESRRCHRPHPAAPPTSGQRPHQPHHRRSAAGMTRSRTIPRESWHPSPPTTSEREEKTSAAAVTCMGFATRRPVAATEGRDGIVVVWRLGFGTPEPPSRESDAREFSH